MTTSVASFDIFFATRRIAIIDRSSVLATAPQVLTTTRRAAEMWFVNDQPFLAK